MHQAVPVLRSAGFAITAVIVGVIVFCSFFLSITETHESIVNEGNEKLTKSIEPKIDRLFSADFHERLTHALAQSAEELAKQPVTDPKNLPAEPVPVSEP